MRDLVILRLYRHSRKRFEKVFHAHEGSHLDFWEHVGKAEWGANHPALQNRALLPWAIPCRLFGDAFRNYKRQKILALTFKAVGAKGHPFESRHWFTGIPDHMLWKVPTSRFNTLRWLLDYFVDLFNPLADGVGPSNPVFLLSLIVVLSSSVTQPPGL